MHFELTASEALPPLGWLGRVDRFSSVVKVWHGRQVSLDENAFWEGINPIPADPSAVIRHHFPLASGGAVEEGNVVFFTPGHALDRVYGFENGSSFWLSNSLPLILAATKQKLRRRYMFYPWQFDTIDRHDRALPLEGRNSLRIFYNCNIRINSDLSYRCERRTSAYHFDSYATYLSGLKQWLDAVLEANGKGANRHFKLISALSRGYDSTAVSALATEFGLQEIISIRDSRGGEEGSEDVTPVAVLLGVRLHAINRSDYRKYGLEAEKIFYLTAVADDICLYPFRDLLAGRILIGGFHGDIQWDRNQRPASRWTGTWNDTNGGLSMQEFRIRSGYISCPLAFFGWQHYRDIIRLSRSDEMKPWSVGGTYDRPIPRRIAEEAGVPREWFGKKKMAVTVTLGQGEEDDTVSADLQRLVDEHWAGLSDPYTRAMRSGANFANGLLTPARDWYQSHPSWRQPTLPEDRPALYRLAHEGLMYFRDHPLSRKFLRPVKPMSFAAQVTNHLVAAEYAGILG